MQFIHGLLDDGIINRLLAYDGYTPSMRELFPCNFFRAGLLKALKYPEISYRKFCDPEHLGLDRKQNRFFIGLPLHKKTMIDHSQLSKFRSGLSFVQQVNLHIPVDGGLFQLIPYETEQIKQAHEIRKNCERPFNLLKNQTGLETVRVRSRNATMARCTLSSIAVLLIKMAGARLSCLAKRREGHNILQ